MPLKVEDFDFYYLIINSRGPGSETITVNKLDLQPSELSDEEIDELDEEETAYGMEFDEFAEEDFAKFGVCSANNGWNDEGPIVAVRKGTKPLKGIWQWLVADNERSKAYMAVIDEVDVSDFAEKLKEMQNSVEQAYLSACLRAFLPTVIKEDDNPWTSCNAWRNLEIEIPSKQQFEALMEATGETAEAFGKWNCKVLQEASKRYLAGTLKTREFTGP